MLDISLFLRKCQPIEGLFLLGRLFLNVCSFFLSVFNLFLLSTAFGVCISQDLHYMAQDKGETALAEVAKRKAEQADAESIGG